MRRSGAHRFGFLSAVLVGVWITWAAAAAWSFEWKTATPESQGMSGDRLDALQAELARRGTAAFLVIRNDRIVYEWYADGRQANDKHYTASLAKAIVGGASLAVAITDGRISLDDPAANFVSAWRNDPQKSQITVRQLGSHTSGLSDATSEGVDHPDQSGWKGQFWQRLPPPNDPFTIARDKTPLLFAPGERIQYSNPGIGMLTYCVTAAMREGDRATDVRSLLRERIMRPIGVADDQWSCGYGKTFEVDGLPLVAAWGGGEFTPRATASVGRLLLREGDWEGARLLSRDAVRQVTGDAGLPGHCGMGFWTNGDGRYAKLPRDTYYGAGAGDQLLIVIPSLNLIVVRNGAALAPKPPDAADVFEAFHDARVRILFEPVVAAIIDGEASSRSDRQAPYPPSDAIAGVVWAPPETIVRRAEGSDNWPLTWADDGHLYGAYGDGNGFEPRTPEKLSLGLARIEGGPRDFRGVNLRSPTLEQRGDGAAGKKASGLLMVDGVLYLWARNAGNSQLAWSDDRGRNWMWADWKFDDGLGCPAFLNFGSNYAEARDGFVYVYSHDADSAYELADRVTLARVPKRQIRDRNEYEFLQGVDDAGQSQWTDDIRKRGAAFVDKCGCYRASASYHARLERYLLVLTMPVATEGSLDARFAGGLAIYDAPEPWGPWTTAFFAPRWDVGPGETASLPPKWMDEDGRTMYLTFSGDDAFSVRRATLRLRPAHTPAPQGAALR